MRDAHLPFAPVVKTCSGAGPAQKQKAVGNTCPQPIYMRYTARPEERYTQTDVRVSYAGADLSSGE